ncbi:MAG TPA: hypothetical protein VH253_03635 [Phycisphaerae bacterium]|nr:hypothetical protein [Phycisphaerae bacterium]
MTITRRRNASLALLCLLIEASSAWATPLAPGQSSTSLSTFAGSDPFNTANSPNIYPIAAGDQNNPNNSFVYGSIGSAVAQNPDGTLLFTYRFVESGVDPAIGKTITPKPITAGGQLFVPVSATSSVDISLLPLPGGTNHSEVIASRSDAGVTLAGLAATNGFADPSLGFALNTSATQYTLGQLTLTVPGDPATPVTIEALVPSFSQTPAVPEPASLCLIPLATISLIVRCRRTLA